MNLMNVGEMMFDGFVAVKGMVRNIVRSPLLGWFAAATLTVKAVPAMITMTTSFLHVESYSPRMFNYVNLFRGKIVSVRRFCHVLPLFLLLLLIGFFLLIVLDKIIRKIKY